MTHLDVWAMEVAMLTHDGWARWIAEAERIAGHDLDGDQDQDGYSLDYMMEMFDAGKSVDEALETVFGTAEEWGVERQIDADLDRERTRSQR